MKPCFLNFLLILHIALISSDDTSYFQVTPHESIKFWPNWLDILDLSEYLEVFQHVPSLLMIDNYFNVDIIAPTYPVLIRKYVKATLGYQSATWTFQKLVWVNPSVPVLNWT